MNNTMYESVIIGNQEWMTKNLAVTKDNKGNDLILGKDYFFPGNDAKNVPIYGLLYTWEAAMRIVPDGWHLPSQPEWREMKESLELRGYSESKVLAYTDYWKEDNENWNPVPGKNLKTNNSSGFGAVPAGDYVIHKGIGEYENFGTHASFWSATPDDNLKGVYYTFFMAYNGPYVGTRGMSDAKGGHSVRCVRGKANYQMKNCIYCNTLNHENVYSCVKCGGVFDRMYCPICGNELSKQFCTSCGANLNLINGNCVDIQGRSYKTLQIGNCEWMAENLAVTKDAYGNDLVYKKDYWYPYGDKEKVKEYGLLYTWNAAMKISPKGWRLPTLKEFEKVNLRSYIFSKYLAASYSGSGYRSLDYEGNFWTSEEESSDRAFFRYVDFYLGRIDTSDAVKDLGFSVRCIRNLDRTL